MLTGFSAYDGLRRGTPVVVAAADLAAGHVLTAGDVAVVAVPAEVAAEGGHTDIAAVVGQRVALPMRRNEPVTDVRLLDGGLLAGLGPSLRAVPVRVADAGVAELVHQGSAIDVYAPAETRSPSAAVATGVTVLRVLAPDGSGLVLVVAADEATAARLSAAAANGGLSIALRAPPPGQ